MTDLEKEMHQEYQSRPRTGRRVDDAIKAAAIVAERHIEQKLLQHSVMQGLAELSDEVLAEAFAILFDKEWKRYWHTKSKADEMRSIIRANDQPCRPFENWVKCIDFLRTQASPTVASEGMEEANTCADAVCPRCKGHDTIDIDDNYTKCYDCGFTFVG